VIATVASSDQEFFHRNGWLPGWGIVWRVTVLGIVIRVGWACVSLVKQEKAPNGSHSQKCGQHQHQTPL
jgi:hypothetical protein